MTGRIKEFDSVENPDHSLYNKANIFPSKSSATVHNDKKEIVQGLVSVIMPVYNTPDEYLTAAVRSVLNQTYDNLELLIIDDGSEYECANTCDNIEKNDRVRVFHIKNSGASAARNIGLDEAQGEFIAFIDSDDTLANNAIKILTDEIIDADFVAMGCNHVQKLIAERCVDNKESIKANPQMCMEYLCYMNPPYSHIESNAIWGKLYRQKLIGDIRFDEEMMLAEDFKFNFNYIIRNGTGKYLDYIGYNYLEHDDSISRSYKPAMIKTIDAIERMIYENENTSNYDALVSRCVNIAFTILMMVPDGVEDKRKRIEQFISFYRNQVVRNPNTKNKVRIACLMSCFGYRITKKIFEIYRR